MKTRSLRNPSELIDLGFIKDLEDAQRSTLVFQVPIGDDREIIEMTFTIVPYYGYEESGPDRMGDYYIVEADFTAHNGLLSEHFMNELGIRISLQPWYAHTLPSPQFYSSPIPSTTISGVSYKKETTVPLKVPGQYITKWNKTTPVSDNDGSTDSDMADQQICDDALTQQPDQMEPLLPEQNVSAPSNWVMKKEPRISANSGITVLQKKEWFSDDVAILLNTSPEGVIDYRYVIQNTDEKDKGLPVTAVSDLTCHSSWIWRIPIDASALPGVMKDNPLYNVVVEVNPVYCNQDTGDSVYPDRGKVLAKAFPIIPPVRDKCQDIVISNDTRNTITNIRIISTTYNQWVSDSAGGNNVLASCDEPCCAGQSKRMTIRESDFYVVYEERGRSLNSRKVRKTIGPVSGVVDPLHPVPIYVTTIDGSDVE